jgi:hypothetical protein
VMPYSLMAENISGNKLITSTRKLATLRVRVPFHLHLARFQVDGNTHCSV